MVSLYNFHSVLVNLININQTCINSLQTKCGDFLEVPATRSLGRSLPAPPPAQRPLSNRLPQLQRPSSSSSPSSSRRAAGLAPSLPVVSEGDEADGGDGGGGYTDAAVTKLAGELYLVTESTERHRSVAH